MSITHPTHSDLSALDRAPVWLNSEPLTAEELRGRVVLVDIWTYSCVNWLRTLPYVSAWAERYRDRGLVVVGAHCPEFGFEHDLDNVRHATRRAGRRLPGRHRQRLRHLAVVGNRYWPALYLVDRDGRIRFHHFGEGNYEETERAIQQLLGIDEETVRVDAGGLAEAADWDTLRTPETYIGYGRGARPRRLARATGAQPLGALRRLVGRGGVRRARAPPAARSRIRFQARDLNLVLAPPTSGAPVRFTVRLDGQPPGDDHGLDVNELGEGTVDEPRMYQLVRQRRGAAERTFEITFLDPGVRAYVFTFG